jgi:hypothetical protein
MLKESSSFPVFASYIAFFNFPSLKICLSLIFTYALKRSKMLEGTGTSSGIAGFF